MPQAIAEPRLKNSHLQPVSLRTVHPDIELLRLVKQLQAHYDTDWGEDPVHVRRCIGIATRYEAKIAATPARTLQGLRAKALAIRLAYCDDDLTISDLHSTRLIAESIVANLLAVEVC